VRERAAPGGQRRLLYLRERRRFPVNGNEVPSTAHRREHPGDRARVPHPGGEGRAPGERAGVVIGINYYSIKFQSNFLQILKVDSLHFIII